MFKKVLCLLLAAGLLVGLAGCGKQETAQQGGEQVDKGRYVEKEISLPEDISGNIYHMGKKGDNLCLYVQEKKEGGVGVACYLYKDGSFEKDTPAWLESLVFTEEQMALYGGIRVVENVGGKSYLYVNLIEGENIIGHLYCSKDGVGAEDVTPKDWLEEDPDYHYFDSPQDIAVMEDGSIVAHFYSQEKIYDGETLSLIKEFRFPGDFSGEYMQNIYAAKDKFYLLVTNYTGSGMVFGGIDVYKQGTDMPEETIRCEQEIGNGNFLDILSDGSLVICGEKGFFKKNAGEDKWEKVIEGIYTSLALNDMYCGGIAALDNGSYYAFFSGSGKDMALMEYVYDAEAVLTPQTVLTVYSLYENAAVKQAAALYTKQHPDVLVQVETGIPYQDMETADVDSILQSLNAKLIAKEGADILVMDGLDADSFVEKGLLVDVQDVIRPMAEDGTLLKNIVDGYTMEDGAIYMMPMKISLNVLIGSKIDAKEAGSIEGMAQVLAGKQEPILGVLTVSDFIDIFVPYMVSDIVNGKEMDKEALAGYLENLKVIADNGGIVENYTDNVYAWNAWDVASDAGAAFWETEGFLQAMFPMAIVDLVKGSWSAFENAYTPVGQLGINSASPNTDVAKDFLKFAFSFEVQDGDFYDGFPVNVEALENQIKKDRSDYAAYTTISIGGGQETGFEIGAVSEENGKRMIEACKEADKIIIRDKEIEKVMAEVLPAYLNGQSSLEETVDKMERSLSMYLAE